jgi:hypothetical protein
VFNVLLSSFPKSTQLEARASREVKSIFANTLQMEFSDDQNEKGPAPKGEGPYLEL